MNIRPTNHQIPIPPRCAEPRRVLLRPRTMIDNVQQRKRNIPATLTGQPRRL
jgi:hypothetical protein